MQKYVERPLPYTKIQSKSIKDLNLQPSTIKSSEIIGKTLQDISIGEEFLKKKKNPRSTGNQSQN